MKTASSRLAFAMTAVACAATSLAQDKGDGGKVSGVVFGDFYAIRGHNDAAIKGKDGFWVRRLYLTYDRKIDAKTSAQLRLEAKDPGDFATTATMEPFIKDLWVRYNENGHKFTLGLIPTPTWGPAESILGYRPVEKTALDLFRMGSARDKGISVEGPLAKNGSVDYAVMVGDGSGTKSSKGDTRAYYAKLGFKLTPDVTADLYADSWKKEAGAAWRTTKVELFYVGKGARAGVAYASQLRRKPGAPNSTINVLSLYGEIKAGPRVSPFVRFDTVSDALPDADKIEFYKMSKDGKPALFMVGVRLKVNDAFEIVPSFTTVAYRTGSGGIKPSADSIFRITYSGKF